MNVYNFDYKITDTKEKFTDHSTLLIGQFEIFHIGHQELLDQAKEISSKNKIGITLFNIKNSKEIIPIENQLNNLAKIGFNFVLLIEFDPEFKNLSAKDFIDHIVHKYHIQNIVIGQDFRFGKNRMWGVNELGEYFKNTFICPIKKINDIKIASSRIKEMIATGEVSLVNELSIMTYNPKIFLQANKVIWSEEIIKPHCGIYYIKIAINEYWYHGLLHLSMKNENKIYLLNYQENIVDDFYTIEIIQESRIIINSRFDLIDEKDKQKCLEFFYFLQKKNI